jgi:hypothetical protein
MIRIFILLLNFSGLLPAADQTLQPASTATKEGCRVIKPEEYLDKYFVCGSNPRRADILQISYGNSGPKLHIFTSKEARALHYAKIGHADCTDLQVAAGSKADKLIQRKLRKYLK